MLAGSRGETSNVDNPAQRLYMILCSMKDVSANAKTEKRAWEHALGTSGSDGLLLHRLAETLALAGEVDSLFQDHPDREHYMSWAPGVHKLFAELRFTGEPSGRVGSVLNDIMLERLRNCAVRVSEMDLGPEIGAKGITELVLTLDAAKKMAVENAELGDEVKAFVVQQCTAVQDALKSYPVTGRQGLRVAAEASIGRWFTSPEITAKVPSGVVKAFREVLTRILTNVVSQVATKRLTESVDRWLS